MEKRKPKKNQIWGVAAPTVKILGMKNEFVYYIGTNGYSQPLNKKHYSGFMVRYSRFI